VSEKRTDVPTSVSSEDKIRARLRELTDATRQVRQELEELIKRPDADLVRGEVRNHTPENSRGE
jgi:hypothetical protein